MGSTSDAEAIIVPLTGDLDISRYAEIVHILSNVPHGLPVLVELRGTNHVDSFALSELVVFRRNLEREGRRVALFVASAAVRRMLAIANVTELLHVFAVREEALEFLQADPSLK